MEKIVSELARVREANNPSLLDLILASDFNPIENFSSEARFDKSDHLTFLMEIKNSYFAKKNVKPGRLDFNGIDYNKFRSDLSKVQ